MLYLNIPQSGNIETMKPSKSTQPLRGYSSTILNTNMKLIPIFSLKIITVQLTLEQSGIL